MTAQPQTPVFGHAAADRHPGFMAVADSIGRQLVRDAVWDGDRCSWLVWSKEPIGGVFHSVYRAASIDLYQGVSGIALFMAHLSAFTNDVNQRRAANAAARQIVVQLTRPVPDAIGFYTGALGAAWALTRIGELTGNDTWIELGLRQIERSSAGPAPEAQLDLLGGRAGAIVALVDLAQHFDRPDFLNGARRFAEDLLRAAQASEDGLSWPLGAPTSRNLLGLSHGTAGFALAFLELNHACPDPRYLQAALSALRYERRHFNAVERAWPDFRSLPGVLPSPPSYPTAWCHGSTGIGLSRLRIRELLPNDPEIMPELDAAIASAVRALNAPMLPASTDFTLCHGVAGNNELLLLAGQHFGRPEAFAAARRVGGSRDAIVS